MFKNDSNWIVAGAVAAILLPVLAVIGVPFVIAAILAALAFVGLVILLSPRRLFEGINIAGIGKQRLEFARELLTEAAPAAERLGMAGRRIADPIVRHKVTNLADISREILEKVEANPARASAARRFLSYYLPQAAEVAEGYATIESKRAPKPERLEAVAGMIEKLEGAFIHYADDLAESDLGTLDVDLKLIEASLKEDMRR